MKIKRELREVEDWAVGNLAWGDVFEYQGNLYILTGEHDGECKHLVVNLQDGAAYHFSSDLKVFPHPGATLIY